ncbi:PucR family transcriptional regulator [Microbacterium istanbulense]|uniref:PucR family transcriptional regulator n=1 Tax=Microbacterium istanbulense TaxID=3122049 RepID=A0ABU8LIA6_9MICO
MSADRQDLTTFRTDRPEGAALPSVGEVLAERAVRLGDPEVLVGGAALQAPVRWVHVSDSDRVAPLLDGGELLLSTAAAWSGDSAALRALADSLADVGVAGVVVELGNRFSVMPPAFVAACRERGLALIVLHREVKFVALTEAVHRRIIAGQLEALQERQRLHELFTGLSLRGAPADTVVHETARVLGAPVVLEALDREVVAADTRDLSVAELLAGWAARSRAGVGLTAVPVEARGERWGTLATLDAPAHPAGTMTVLQLAATALAFSRLADGPGAWTALAARELVSAVAGGQHTGVDDVAARLESAGLPLRGRVLGVWVAERADAAAVAAALAVCNEIDGLHARGAVHDGAGVFVLSSAEPVPTAALARVASVLPAGLAVGAPAANVPELLASVRAARLLAARLQPGELRRVDDRPLTRLVTELGADHRLQEHSERMLAPLIRHDDATGGDLVRVLRAVVAHPGNRTAAAAASHLSRSVFYQRIALISDLLGADLDDGETLAGLHLALLAAAR